MSLAKPKRVRIPKASDEEVELARQRQARAALAAKGRQSTILTGASGATGGSVTRPTLLGR